MEVRTLGRLGRAFGDAGGSVPPSSQSVVRMLRGERGGIPAVIGSTLLRAILFVPTTAGVAYFAGARRGKLWGLTAAGALGSSLGITLFLVVWHKMAGTASGGAGYQTPTALQQGNAPVVPGQLPATDATTIASQVMQSTTQQVEGAIQDQSTADAPTAGLRRAVRGFGGPASFGSSW